jgi:hypothetical protein
MTASTGCLSPALVRLLAVARAEPDQHVMEGGICREYCVSWPGEPATLAVFTLGSL